MYNKIVIHPTPLKKPRDWTQNPGWHLRWKAREANRHYAIGIIIPAIKRIGIYYPAVLTSSINIFIKHLVCT